MTSPSPGLGAEELLLGGKTELELGGVTELLELDGRDELLLGGETELELGGITELLELNGRDDELLPGPESALLLEPGSTLAELLEPGPAAALEELLAEGSSPTSQDDGSDLHFSMMPANFSEFDRTSSKPISD